MEELRLFKQAPLRTKNGRYCTKEQLRIERVDFTNKTLTLERDKYYRAWAAAAAKATRLERELTNLKKKIGELV